MKKTIKPHGIDNNNRKIGEIYDYISYPEASIPYQGWKIHISSNLEDYQSILDHVYQVCSYFQTPFKYVNKLEELFHILSKKTSQLEIGKFITIYPKNKETFLSLLEELYINIPKCSGVQIMTDRNYKDLEIIFYRYGVMNARIVNNERPKLKFNNKLYEDLVEPYYSCPPFVEDVIFDTIESESTTESLFNSRYKMLSILHKTGAGNLYIAIDSYSEKQVVIKEARKKVYITKNILAIDLLLNEKSILQRLKGKVNIPNFVECFSIDGNFYLVQEFIEGQRLDVLKSTYNMLVKRDSNELIKYNKKVKKLIDNLFFNLNKFHKEGIILEDISFSNILLTKDNRLFFIDFETAYLKNDGIIVETTNECYPKKISQKNEQRDITKMWYCIIDLLTNSTSLLKYDITGVSTLNLFYKMCLENKFPKLLRNKFINDFRMVEYKEAFILKFIEMGIKIEEIIRMQQELTDTILSQNTFDFHGNTILESIDNYIQINNMDLKFSRNPDFSFLYYKHNKSIDELIGAAILDNNIDQILINNNLDDLLNGMKYYHKYYLLRLLNDNKLRDNLYFIKILESIFKNDIESIDGVAYVKSNNYFSPYLITGNSGLIIELIRFSINNKTVRFDKWIRNLSEGVGHTYAKGTSLYYGLAGLGLANAWLFHYFNEAKFLKTSIKISNHIFDYSIKQNTKTILIDPISKNIDYTYSKGMLGQLYFINELINIIKE
ncbi:class III lanthionine synthetase LanKC N-terminal domain-containing protein [Streptococcus phocae subsp. phocae]